MARDETGSNLKWVPPAPLTRSPALSFSVGVAGCAASGSCPLLSSLGGLSRLCSAFPLTLG